MLASMSDIPEQHQACGTEVEAMQCPNRAQRQTEDIHGVGQVADIGEQDVAQAV